MDAALYTLPGVIVGAATSFGGTYLQQRQQDRRDRLRMAVDLGLEDYKHELEIARATHGGLLIAPVEVYVNYHASILDAVAKGKLTPQKVMELKVERNQMGAAFAKHIA